MLRGVGGTSRVVGQGWEAEFEWGETQSCQVHGGDAALLSRAWVLSPPASEYWEGQFTRPNFSSLRSAPLQHATTFPSSSRPFSSIFCLLQVTSSLGPGSPYVAAPEWYRAEDGHLYWPGIGWLLRNWAMFTLCKDSLIFNRSCLHLIMLASRLSRQFYHFACHKPNHNNKMICSTYVVTFLFLVRDLSITVCHLVFSSVVGDFL